MVDILERLRSPQTSLGTLWPQPNLHEEAADEITRLREENAAERLVAKDNLDWFNALKTDYDALREENARLREERDLLQGIKAFWEAVNHHVPYAENTRLREENARLRNCIRFFASVIKSGEEWSETCQQKYAAAIQEGEKG